MAPISGRRAERVRDSFRRPLVIGREGDRHVTIVKDGVVGAMALGDEKTSQAVARHERERRLKKIELPQRREFVEHQENAMPAVLRLQFLG